MAYNRKHLSFEEQISLFESRGMSFPDKSKALSKLEHINYYKLKEFAIPFEKSFINEQGKKDFKYENICFDEVISRFYKDKNLRVHLLHCIEKIEVSVKTKFAHILGESDPFLYLNFSNWCNRDIFNSRKDLLQNQYDFIAVLNKSIEKTSNSEIKRYINEYRNNKLPIWLAIEVMTFGNVMHLISIMSNERKDKLSNYYDCTFKELESWLNCIKLVRNLCAHNSNVIDIKISTMPKIKSTWNDKLYSFKKGNSIIQSNRIALSILIIVDLTKKVNRNYDFSNIYRTLSSLIDNSDSKAVQLGFKNKKSIDFIKPRTKKRFHKTKTKNMHHK